MTTEELQELQDWCEGTAGDIFRNEGVGGDGTTKVYGSQLEEFSLVIEELLEARKLIEEAFHTEQGHYRDFYGRMEKEYLAQEAIDDAISNDMFFLGKLDKFIKKWKT